MFNSAEVERGIAVFKETVEAGRVLHLATPQPMRDRFAFSLVLEAFGKEWDFTLTGEVLSDFPHMPEYKKAARSYAQALAQRMRNPMHKAFFCRSGRPISVDIEWPIEPLPMRAASALRCRVNDTRTNELAHCYIVITYQQSMFDLKSDPFLIQRASINSIRSAIDGGSVTFFPGDRHPLELQAFELVLRNPQPASHDDIDRFLEGKVHWLAFRINGSSARIWVPDPWDAEYLGCNTRLLSQQAEILGAKDELVFDESGEFASIGKNLLKKGGEFESATRPDQVLDKRLEPEWDVFISHATEDKGYVEPLAKELEAAGIHVWFDKNSLAWGDDLRPTIDRGLIACKYGIVVFSKAFLRRKKWTEYELNSLFAREKDKKKVILPIWHGVTREDLSQYSPAFSDRLAKISTTDSHADIVKSLLDILGRTDPREHDQTHIPSPQSNQPKPNPVAFAWYQKTGTNEPKVGSYVRPSIVKKGWFTFDSSLGGEFHGTREEIAQKFVAFDRSMTMNGYVRTHHGNSGDAAFVL